MAELGFHYGPALNPNVMGATFPGGSRTGLVQRPQGLTLTTEALFGTPAVAALLEQMDAVLTVLARDLEVHILFGPSSARSAVQNAIIGLAHSTGAGSSGGKGVPFLGAAVRSGRAARGQSAREQAAPFVRSFPTRNPYYQTGDERRAWRRLLREGFARAVTMRDPSIWEDTWMQGARLQIQSYHRHFVDQRLLVTASRFVPAGAPGGAALLSPRYAKWKAKRYPGRPILTATGQLRDSLIATWIRR